MKILLTGGGSGGHFYPLIAVAEKINKVLDEEKILDAKLYFMSNSPYSKKALFDNRIKFVEVIAGKQRLYRSFKNVTDLFKIGIGCVTAIFKMFAIYPDVVFGKGGYASFPALFAARILRIPVVIHESDSIPGKVNRWAGKFATRIAISYDEAIEYFPKAKTALTGQPIREAILKRGTDGSFEHFDLDPTIPTILVLGGSFGAEIINNTLIDDLPLLLEKYQIIHQAGEANIADVIQRVSIVLEQNPLKNRYKPFATLDDRGMKMAAGTATLIISRAGSTIFEIANWGIPSIIIPISPNVSHDQHDNAYNYARSGSCDVIDENNLAPSILSSEITKLIENKERMNQMSKNALAFSRPDAAQQIARVIVDIALSHES